MSISAAVTSKKRALPEHTKIPSADILNSWNVQYAQKVFDKLHAQSAHVDECAFPGISIKDGEYPRKKLNNEDKDAIQDEEIRRKANEIDQIRIPYHMIAWRAAGNVVPDFGSGQDISHKCKRGQMRLGSKGSFKCSEVKFGCFSKECLEVSSHADNLDRGRCKPIVKCSICKHLFLACSHDPNCGTSKELEAEFKSQGKIKRIRIEYEDGRVVDLE